MIVSLKIGLRLYRMVYLELDRVKEGNRAITTKRKHMVLRQWKFVSVCFLEMEKDEEYNIMNEEAYL